MEEELSVLRSNLEEEQKKQITLIKQVLITYSFYSYNDFTRVEFSPRLLC